MGLGNAFMEIMGTGAFIGLNMALCTLASQGYGAQAYDLCGVYLNQARVVFIGFYCLMIPVFLFSERMFLALGQQEEVAFYSSQYL